jgi:hypothetical protein
LEVVVMTPDLSPEAFANLGAPDLVYVRPIRGAELLAQTPVADIQGYPIEPDQILYAVHSADGVRLGVMTDRETAIASALAHELEPVSVH